MISSSQASATEQSATGSDDDSSPAEAELVQETLDGSGTAAREIVRLHHRRVFGFLCKFTRHHQDAEDIAQETFIKAFRSLHRFDTSRPLANWLLTIARRTALNHFRSAKKWEELPEDSASSAPTPASAIEERDEVDDIWDRARRTLPRREYEILWLRFGENLSTEETARTVGLTVTHTKVLVFRARQRLMERKARP